jgi:heptosyltransferase-1
MRVLIVKTSSLGDVIHTLPALTDASQALPGIRFDWVVEESFAEIPAWHPAVDTIIPVALRRWRHRPLHTLLGQEWRTCKSRMSAHRYDAIIDAQGLLKSALLTRYARGTVHGLDRTSAREPLASRFYTHRHPIAWGQHAVERVRTLFAQALGYPRPDSACVYGLDSTRVPGFTAAHQTTEPYLVFLHGTTWATKHWPELYWRRLAEQADATGWAVRLPWGSEVERLRAERLAQGLPHIKVLPRRTLAGMAAELVGARACIAVDTGLGHLAAAFDVPTVSLFGPTNPAYTGAWGPRQLHLKSDFACAPCLKKSCTHTPTADEANTFNLTQELPLCFTRLDPEQVWAHCQQRLLAA